MKGIRRLEEVVDKSPVSAFHHAKKKSEDL